MSSPFTIIGPRVRKSPYFKSTQQYGCKAYTVYNHMYMPLYYTDPVTEYWHLLEHVCLWDVACERQVEIRGPDAGRFTRLLTPRNLSTCVVGQGVYAPLVNESGGLLNDPVILKLAEDRYWLSLADSDILHWCQGLVHNLDMDVTILEPYVSPLAIQGPRAESLAVDLFGSQASGLKYFWFRETDLQGIPLVLARSGWSKQGGFELYLQDSRAGNDLWEIIMQAGEKYSIAPGAPSTIERIESGLLSYGADITMENNPLEAGLERYIDLDQATDFIGKEALLRIREEGIRQKLVGLEIQAEPLPGNENRWPVFCNGNECGTVRSAVYSPRLQKNIALAMLSIEMTRPGTPVQVETPAGAAGGEVVRVPFS